MEHSQANTTNEKLEKKKLSLTSPTFSNFSFQSSDSKVSSVNTSMALVNNKPQLSNSSVHGRPIEENRKQGNNKGKKFIADDFVPLQDNSSILAELNKSTPAGEVKEGAKKKKKKNKKRDMEEHPWAKPLKKPTKTAEAFVEKKFAKFEVKEEKRQAAKKRNVEEAKENKVEEEKEIVKKINFVRIRDIIKQHFSKRKIAEQPKKLDLQKMKQLLGIKKKKKMSKMKRAKLQYLESKMRHERQKTSKKQDDDGYETIEETDPNKPIEDEEQEIKEDAEPQDRDDSREHSEDKEISDQSKNFVAKYGEIIPEILLPSEKRPQTVYKETMAIRNWVDHILCDEIDNLAFTLLNKLVCTQILKKLNQPNKFKKRVVCGMREVLRTIESNLTDRSSQCVLIAVNVQENPMRDGGDEKMLEIIAKARRKGIPIVHTCTRKRLGQACTGNDFARISVASITNYFGADELYKELLELVEKKREEFKQKVESSENL